LEVSSLDQVFLEMIEETTHDQTAPLSTSALSRVVPPSAAFASPNSASRKPMLVLFFILLQVCHWVDFCGGGGKRKARAEKFGTTQA